MKHPDVSRHLNSNYILNERMHSQEVMQSRASPSNRGLNKMSLSKGSPVPPPPPLITSGKSNQSYPQLSPKMFSREKLVSAPSGGSITQGTPGVPQPNTFGYVPNRGYEGLLRQIPSAIHKEGVGGSITLGTPLLGGNSNLPIDHRRKADIMIGEPHRSELLNRNNVMYDPSHADQYYRRSPPQTSHSYSPGFQQNDYKMNKQPLFHKESHLSTNQIMIDFNTSKQMLTRRGSGSSEKDGRSSTPIHQQMESRSSHSEQKISTQNATLVQLIPELWTKPLQFSVSTHILHRYIQNEDHTVKASLR